MRRRVTTSVIRLETEHPEAYWNPMFNKRYHYGWLAIQEIPMDKMSLNRRTQFFPRYNFTLDRAEGYRS